MRETWDKIWDKEGALDIDKIIKYDNCYHLLKRLIEHGENLTVLDAGCGRGIYTLALLKEYPYSAILVDNSPVALSLARKNATQNGVDADFILADIFNLPFPDETFDIVWNGGVNEHFENQKRQLIFNEMARVCKLGGQVVVIVPDSTNIPYRLWKKVLEIKGRWRYGFEKPYSAFELKRRMKNAGLVPTKISGGGTLTSLTLMEKLILGRRVKLGNKFRGILRKAVLKTDKMLGFLGGFTGYSIGVRGVK